MRIFDTHCHINSEEYDNILDEVINRAHNQNVTDMMVIGTDLNSSLKASSSPACAFLTSSTSSWVILGLIQKQILSVTLEYTREWL